MIIHPEVIVTPDQPTVKFRQPRDQVNLDEEIPKILHTQGWTCGTYFNIQFVSHDQTELLATAEYVVTQAVEASHTNESNPYQPVTKMITKRKAEIVDGWRYYNQTGSVEKTVKWNPGKKKHQVLVGDQVIAEYDDKDEAIESAAA